MTMTSFDILASQVMDSGADDYGIGRLTWMMWEISEG